MTTRARRGVFVAEPSAEDLIEIYQVREAIEVQAVELLIASGDGAAGGALAETLPALDPCWDRGDHDAAVARGRAVARPPPGGVGQPALGQNGADDG